MIDGSIAAGIFIGSRICKKHQARLRQMTCQPSVGTAPLHRSRDAEASLIARIDCIMVDTMTMSGKND